MFRQGPYGPRLALEQKSVVFGAEKNNYFICFSVFPESFCLYVSTQWVFSYILESRTISTGRIEEDRLMVTWYTDDLGLTPWSELGRLKAWVSVIANEVFDHFCAIGSAGTWWRDRDWSHHSVRNFISNAAKSVAGTYIGKFWIWQTSIVKWKKKKVSIKSILASNLVIRWLGKVDTFLKSFEEITYKVFQPGLFLMSMNLVALK